MKLAYPTCGCWLVCSALGLLGFAWAGLGADSLARPSAGPASLPESTRCMQCHRFESGLTHPVDVTPSIATPDALPLESGRITCITCHDAGPRHTESHAAVGVRSVSDQSNLCLQCHKDASPRSSAIHAQTTGKAHLTPGNLVGKGSASGLDDESRDCMSCHDGAAASDAGSHGLRLADDSPAVDHPIGIPMRPTPRAEKSDFKLASVAGLDRRLRLFNGAVGCGSCHSVYSRERSQLAVSNLKSKLCLSCHTQ